MEIKTWYFNLINAYDNTLIREVEVHTTKSATYKQAFNKAWFRVTGKDGFLIGYKLVKGRKPKC